jgi:flagellar hook-associated protein 2
VAVDSQFSLNGVAMTRKTNVVTDAAEGLTLTLKKGDGTGTVTTFTVAVDKSAITAAANDVASKFNTAYRAYKNAAVSGGALAGDSTIRTLFSRIRSTFTAVPSGVALDSSYSSVASLGFKTNQDGTLSVSSTALQDALDKNITQVQAVFTGTNTATSSLLQAITAPGSGNLALTLSSIDQQNLTLSRQITTLQARLDRRREYLQNQYATLESVVGQLQAAGQSLSGLR